MSEQIDLNRRVAELLGWPYEGLPTFDLQGNRVGATLYAPTTDANQADAAVREWCGDDPDRIYRFCSALYRVTGEVWTEHVADLYVIATATPEQKIRALLAAADALKDEGGGS